MASAAMPGWHRQRLGEKVISPYVLQRDPQPGKMMRHLIEMQHVVIPQAMGVHAAVKSTQQIGLLRRLINLKRLR